MKGLLIETRVDLALPYGGSTWFATLAHEQIPGAEDELVLLVFLEVHLGDVFEIEAAPLNVRVPKIGPCTGFPSWLWGTASCRVGSRKRR
jgi:hypothetical protein